MIGFVYRLRLTGTSYTDFDVGIRIARICCDSTIVKISFIARTRESILWTRSVAIAVRELST